jgi:PKD repeat protein
MRRSDIYSLLFVSFLLAFSISLKGQTPTLQDCLGAIPVCQESYTQTNVYNGYGSFNEIPSTGSCPNNCMDGEKNSVWYIITVQSAGMMSFEIDPIVSNDDYDWGVYNLTEAECGDIYGNPSLQVACNAAGGSGYHGNTGSWTAMGGTSACEGGGNTNKWCADIPVQEGETYVICVSNWTQSVQGYTIDFSPSTANIYDDVKPYISWVQEAFGCSGETEVNFEFSEFMLCESVNPSDFMLLDPNGNELTILDVIGEACEDGGTQEVNFKIVLDPSTPVIETGMHSLVIDGPVADLCSNYANLEAFDFMVVTDAPYVDFDGLPANACITDSPKELVSNRDEGTYSISPDCGDCLEDHGDGTATLTPTLMGVGLYSVTYYYDDGLCDNDTTQLIMMNSLPAVFDLSEGGTFCEGTQGVEITLDGTESMVWYDLKRNGEYLESRLGSGNALSFNYWDVPGTYTVEASSFCGTSTMNGTCVIEEVPAPTVFDISGPDFFCENTEGAIITVNDSEPGVTYELLLNGNPLSPPLTMIGVGGAMDFPPQNVSGTYTVYAEQAGCDNLMNGAVVLAEKPEPEAQFDYSGVCQFVPTQFENQSTISSGTITDFFWDFDDNGATSTDENPAYTFTDFGDHSVTLTIASDFGCESETVQVVNIVEGIDADAGQDEVIPYGTSTTLSGSATGGSSSYSYHWEPEAYVVDPNSASTMTTNLYDDYTFTLTVNDSGSECYGESTVDITLMGGPLRAEPSASAEFVCHGDGVELQANPAGGSENYDYLWTSDPSGYTFDVENPAISSLTQSTTFTVEIDDGYNTVSESIYVAVKPNPDAYAGSDQEIPYDYYTQLMCIINGGGSTFDLQWTPEEFINGNSTIPDPITVSLTENVQFYVEVTNEFGCTFNDGMEVRVTGGPLGTSAYAEDTLLCQYDTLFLHASPFGGGQPWTYEWSVTPGTWTSTEENPYVVVDNTGDYTYHLDLHDLQNTVEKEINVQVNPSPVVDLMNDFDSIVNHSTRYVAVCVYDTVTLDAGNPGFSYIWSTGSTEQAIQVGTTGIGSSTQSYYVDVLDETTGCATSDTINIIYSFAMCSYSINEFNGQTLDVVLFPNPVNNNLNVNVQGITRETEVYITDIQGKRVYYRIAVPANSNPWHHEFDFSAIPAGTYLISFSSGGAVHTEKIVKGTFRQ